MNRMLRTLVAALLLSAAASAWAQTSPSGDIVKPRIEIFDERERAVTFGCDAPAGNVCFFQVLMRLRNVAQRFSIPSGGRYQVTGVIPGVDQYVVTVNQIPPLTLDCRAAPDQQKFCKVGVVGPGYNN
jgi:hypothetical protein